MPAKPKILVLPQPRSSTPSYSATRRCPLHSLGDVTRNSESRSRLSEPLASKIGEYDIIMTGWDAVASPTKCVGGGAQPQADRAHRGQHRYSCRRPSSHAHRRDAPGAIAPAVAERHLSSALAAPGGKAGRHAQGGEPWDTAGWWGERSPGSAWAWSARATGRQVIRLLQGWGLRCGSTTPPGRRAVRWARHSALDDIFAQCPIVSCRRRRPRRPTAWWGPSSLPCCKTRSSSTRPGRTWWTRKRCSLNCAKDGSRLRWTTRSRCPKTALPHVGQCGDYAPQPGIRRSAPPPGSGDGERDRPFPVRRAAALPGDRDAGNHG